MASKRERDEEIVERCKLEDSLEEGEVIVADPRPVGRSHGSKRVCHEMEHVEDLLLDWARRGNGTDEEVEFLVTRGLSPRGRQFAALYEAVVAENTKVIDCIGRFGHALSVVVLHNCMVLAAMYGHLHVLKHLVETHNAPVHRDNEQVFQTACSNGHFEMVKYLLHEHACDVSALNYRAVRETLDHTRANEDCWSLLLEMLGRGLDVSWENHELLKWAIQVKKTDVAMTLIDKGADLLARHGSLLHLCAQNGLASLLAFASTHRRCKHAVLECLEQSVDSLLQTAIAAGHRNVVNFCLRFHPSKAALDSALEMVTTRNKRPLTDRALETLLIRQGATPQDVAE